MQMENKKRMPQQAPQAKADKAPAEQDTALVWGKNPVTELLKSEAGVDTLLLADSMEPRMAGYYTALGKAAGAVIKRVPAGKLQKLCGTQDHQGVAAWAARIQYVGVEELLQIAKDRGEPPFLVLCDGIEDPHNLGAILRSALLCGAHGVIIPRRGGVGVTGTVMKSSAGAAALCGLDQPGAVLTAEYTHNGVQHSFTLTVGGQRGAGYCVTVSDDDTIYLMSAEALAPLLALAQTGLA